jgi:crossover junction endodeoxyribonuclease RuvC
MQPFKIVGVDPGLAATGIAVVTGIRDKVQSYAFGAVQTPARETLPVRLMTIHSRLLKLFQTEKPDLIIVEDVFSLDRFPKSGIILGKVSGVILLACQQTGIAIKEIPVREAKQILTGNGNAGKEQLEAAVRQILGAPEPIRPFHASDALGLALIGLFRYVGDRLYTPC